MACTEPRDRVGGQWKVSLFYSYLFLMWNIHSGPEPGHSEMGLKYIESLEPLLTKSRPCTHLNGTPEWNRNKVKARAMEQTAPWGHRPEGSYSVMTSDLGGNYGVTCADTTPDKR